MGLDSEIHGHRVGDCEACDVRGCGTEIDWAPEGFALLFDDGSIRVACAEKCRDRLLSEPNTGCIGLEDYIRSAVIGLGVEIDEDVGSAPDPRRLAAVLAELESVAALPGVPASIDTRQAIEAGYIGAHHVARAWSS